MLLRYNQFETLRVAYLFSGWDSPCLQYFLFSSFPFLTLYFSQVAFGDIHTIHTYIYLSIEITASYKINNNKIIILLQQTELWYQNKISRYPDSGIGIGSEVKIRVGQWQCIPNYN